MNNYFDNNLANQHDQLIQRAITQLLMLKSHQVQLDQNVVQNIFNEIYKSLNHQVPQSVIPSVENFINNE
jgi:hypothetical protein